MLMLASIWPASLTNAAPISRLSAAGATEKTKPAPRRPIVANEQIPLASDDRTVRSNGQIIADGLLGEALVQLIKLDYFSDTCLPDPRGTINSASYFISADKCFNQQRLPADCRYYQSSVLQVVRLMRRSESFHVFLPLSASLIRFCMLPSWPRHAEFIRRRPLYPTAIDYYLYELKAASPRAAKAIEASQSMSHPYVSGTEMYFDHICRRVSGEIAEEVRLLDLIACGDLGMVRPRGDFWLKKIDELLTPERIDG